MKKVLVLISKNVACSDDLKKEMNSFQQNLDFLEPVSENLVECADQYLQAFEKQKYEAGLIIWITGVAVTNLLLKGMPEVNVFTVESFEYYQYISQRIPVQILVLGEKIIGSKNLGYLFQKFLQDKCGFKEQKELEN